MFSPSTSCANTGSSTNDRRRRIPRSTRNGTSLLAQEQRTPQPQCRGTVPAYGPRRRDHRYPRACAPPDLDPVERAQLLPPDLHRLPDVTLEAERLDPAGNRAPAEMARVTTFGYLPMIAQALPIMWKASGSSTTSTCGMADMISEEAPAQLRAVCLGQPRPGWPDGPSTSSRRPYRRLLQGPRDHGKRGAGPQRSPEQLVLATALAEAGFWNFGSTGPSSPRLTPLTAARGRRSRRGHSRLFYMMLIVLALALPIGVAASIYLEEFAPRTASPT
jgi:hypothetical protein